MQFLGLVTIVVDDYDKALEWYTRILGFTLKADILLEPGKRWVVVSPPGSEETGILLAQAEGTVQKNTIGNQAGGRVAFFLNTDDFSRDFALFTERGVRFLEEPRYEPYGSVAVFEDLYGNRWDLIELKEG